VADHLDRLEAARPRRPSRSNPQRRTRGRGIRVNTLSQPDGYCDVRALRSEEQGDAIKEVLDPITQASGSPSVGNREAAVSSRRTTLRTSSDQTPDRRGVTPFRPWRLSLVAKSEAESLLDRRAMNSYTPKQLADRCVLSARTRYNRRGHPRSAIRLSPGAG